MLVSGPTTTYPSWIYVDVHVIGELDPGPENAVSRAESVAEELKHRNVFTEIETAFGSTIRDFAAHLRFGLEPIM